MKKIFSACLLFIALHTSAQDTTTSKNGQLYFKPFIGYKLDGNRLKQKQLKEEIFKVPAAIPYYKKAISNEIAGYVCIAPTVAFAFLGRQDTKTYPYKNNNGFKIAGIVTGSAVIYFLCRSLTNMNRAIHLRNKNNTKVY